MDKVEFELMTPREVERARQSCPVAYVPIGPQAAGPLGLPEGARVIGMDFPGNSVRSIYFEESAFGITVREVIRGVQANGFRLILLVNGHGAPNHVRTLTRLALETSDEPQVRVAYMSAWGDTPEDDETAGGHADKRETSVFMAIAEEHVRMADLPSLPEPLRYADYGIVDSGGFSGRPGPGSVLPTASDPRYSSRAEGEAYVEKELKEAVAVVRRHLRELSLPEGR